VTEKHALQPANQKIGTEFGAYYSVHLHGEFGNGQFLSTILFPNRILPNLGLINGDSRDSGFSVTKSSSSVSKYSSIDFETNLTNGCWYFRSIATAQKFNAFRVWGIPKVLANFLARVQKCKTRTIPVFSVRRILDATRRRSSRQGLKFPFKIP
jgi:hypothetical protein